MSADARSATSRRRAKCGGTDPSGRSRRAWVTKLCAVDSGTLTAATPTRRRRPWQPLPGQSARPRSLPARSRPSGHRSTGEPGLPSAPVSARSGTTPGSVVFLRSLRRTSTAVVGGPPRSRVTSGIVRPRKQTGNRALTSLACARGRSAYARAHQRARRPPVVLVWCITATSSTRLGLRFVTSQRVMRARGVERLSPTSRGRPWLGPAGRRFGLRRAKSGGTEARAFVAVPGCRVAPRVARPQPAALRKASVSRSRTEESGSVDRGPACRWPAFPSAPRPECRWPSTGGHIVAVRDLLLDSKRLSENAARYISAGRSAPPGPVYRRSGSGCHGLGTGVGPL